MMTYTSGCPKNQNRCWNATGSDPSIEFPRSEGALPVLSSRSNVMPLPKIGKVVTRSTETTKIAHPTKQKCRTECPTDLAIARLTRKVTAPNSDERPSTWRKNTPMETAAEEEKSIPVSGKYNVQPADRPSW